MLIIYLILINAISLFLMLADKHKARKNRWRIPEAVLIWSAVFGGSLGTLAGMYRARHKTRHAKVSIGVPVILAVQVMALVLIFTR